MLHKAPNHNHWYISVIIIFVTQASRCQKEATRWITSLMNSSSSCKPQFKPTSKRWEPKSKTIMRKWWISQKTSKKCLHKSWIILTLWNPFNPRSIHKRFRNPPLWSRKTRGLRHWTVDSIWKLVACGIWNMISTHQTFMNSSSGYNSKETLLWTSRASTTTSRCVLMRLLDS